MKKEDIPRINIIMTTHAQERWAERFKNLNFDYEFKYAKKPSKVELSNIKTQCPDHTHLLGSHGVKETLYFISPKGVVFVCNIDNVVITVFPYSSRGDAIGCGPRKIYRKGKLMFKDSVKNKW